MDTARISWRTSALRAAGATPTQAHDEATSSPGPPDYDGDGRSLHYNVPSTLQDERKHAEGLVERNGAGLRAPRSAVQLQQLRQLPA